MNDRIKPETSSLTSVSPKRRSVPSTAQQSDTETACHRGKSRGRTSEPYMTWLGQSLRQSYEETLNEPVPESFSALLDRLEQEDEEKSAQ